MYRITPKKQYSTVSPDEILCHHGGLSNYIFQNDVFEKTLIDWCITQYKDPTKDFVDIGAHIGTYTWLLAPHFKHTHSFEANKEVYNVLCGNIAMKGLSKSIDAHNIGLSDKEGELTFYDRSADGGMNGFAETEMNVISESKMKVATLDSYDLQNVGFIKIDVEGHELEVLEGAIQTIKNNNYPPIIFETWEPGMHPEFNDDRILKLRKDILNKFQEIGYKTTIVSGYPEMFIAFKENLL